MAEEQLSARALCTLAEVKAFADPDDSGDTGRDPVLNQLINDVSVAVHRAARREFVAVNATSSAAGAVTVDPQERLFYVDELVGYEFDVGDLSELTALTIDGVVVDVATIRQRPRVREPWQPFNVLKLPVTATWNDDSVIAVTARWGFPAIPGDIRRATIATVAMWAARDLESFSEVFVAAEGRIEIPRLFPQQAFDTVMGYRKRRRIGTLRIGSV